MSDEKNVLEPEIPIAETPGQLMLLGQMTSLVCGSLPAGYHKNCQQLWEAFKLGREYEKKGQ